MRSHSSPQPRFAIALRGYDRDEVDSWLLELERRGAEPGARAVASGSAASVYVNRPEAQAGIDPALRSLAEGILARVRQTARELPAQVVPQAEGERDRARRAATAIIEAARSRSAEILDVARRDDDQVAAMVQEARSQVDLYLREGEAVARERGAAKWEAAQRRLGELYRELRRLEELHRDMLAEIAQLEGSVQSLRKAS